MQQHSNSEAIKITDNPFLFRFLAEEFDNAYMLLLEESQVTLSEEQRFSVRRTIFCALAPRIQHLVASMEDHLHTDEEQAFREKLHREMGVLILQFLQAGIFEPLD